MFEINLMLNKSEKNRIGKELENVATYQCAMKDGSSIINPVVMLEYPGVLIYDYVYIPDFKRYYFVTDIVSVRNNLWELHLTVDPLESFKTPIKACTAIIARQEFAYNLYLEDKLMSCYVDRFTIDRRFGAGIFTNAVNSNILIVSGCLNN